MPQESLYLSQQWTEGRQYKPDVANSRLVVEQDDNFDFAIALFREWFAARALVERTISPSEIDLDSDRWVVPLSIAINSEDEGLGPEIMTTLSEKDPSLAALVIREVKHNWSTEDTEETPPSGSTMEIGRRIREAMSNWKEGLGPLISAIGPTSTRWNHSIPPRSTKDPGWSPQAGTKENHNWIQ